MMCFVDLENAMEEWGFDPDKISVRKIRSADGTIKIQQRVELGIVQMHPIGRPDGDKPFGYDSLLDYHSQRLAEYERRNGTTVGFGLTQEECCTLREEASLYYRRYVASFVLEEYDRVVADTCHNLEVFNLIRDHAIDPQDRQRLEGFRPYIIMIQVRALFSQALRDGQHTSAFAHVNRGLMDLRAHFEQQDSEQGYEKSDEVRILRDLRTALAANLPLDHPGYLRSELRLALKDERFEEAARLRDELDHIEKK